MGTTLRDLFESSDKNIKHSQSNTLLGSQRLKTELTGLRTSFIPRSPLLYGSDTIRITTQSTSTVETIKGGANGESGSDGLVGQGLSRVSGGRISSVQEAREGISSKLGLPQKLIPTRVAQQLSLPSNERMDDLDGIRSGGSGTTLGNALSKTGGGTPSQIGKSLIGQGIQSFKQSARDAVLGTGATAGSPENNSSNRFSDVSLYSDNRIDRNSTPVVGFLKGLGNKTSFGTPHTLTPNIELPFSSRSGVSDRKAGGGSIKGEESTDYYTGQEYKEVGEDFTTRNIFDEGNEYSTDAVKVIIQINNKKIMFPLVTLTALSETFSPSWSGNKMIGSPFSHYIYDGIERSLSFSLKMYSINPDEHEKMWSKLNELAKCVYPIRFSGDVGVVTPPITELTIGKLYERKFGFISSLSYTVDDQGGWETGFKDPKTSKSKYAKDITTAGEDWILPKLIDVSIGYTFIESRQDVETKLYSFNPVS